MVFIIGLVALVGYETNFCLGYNLAVELHSYAQSRSCKAYLFAIMRLFYMLAASIVSTIMLVVGIWRILSFMNLSYPTESSD